MVKYQWAFPCELCGEPLEVEYIADKPRQNRTTIIISCSRCGYNYRSTKPSELVDIGPSPAVVPVERRGHYKRIVCAYCGRMLTGRQKKFCSKRCNMRWIRNGNKRSQLR